MDFVNDIKKSGLYVIGHVQQGSMDPSASDAALDPLRQVYPYWLSLIDYLKIKAFVELTLMESVRTGIQQLIRLSGLGAMKPNTGLSQQSLCSYIFDVLVVIGFHEQSAADPILDETHLLKDLKYSKIGRSEVVEYFTDKDFMPRELNVVNSRLDTSTYVDIVHDIMNLNKNLVIARHFSRFDRELLLK
jgi:potassium/chloride transporter 9